MKKYIKILLVFILCLTFSITKVGAKGYIKELFQAEENLKIEEELDGTAFLAGTKVNVKKTINGIGFILGETITIQDKQEYIISASTKINMEAEVENDIFLFTEDGNITGKVNRDVYMYATTASLDGEFGRNIYVAGTTVELNGTFNGNVTVNAMEIKIGDDAKITGTLKYNETATITGLNDNIKTKTYKETSNETTLADYLYNMAVSYINLLLISFILIYMFGIIFTKSIEQVKNNNIFNLCIKGFVILIGIPIVAITLLMTGVLTSIGVVVGIIYGILVYIANIFTSYYLATELDKRFFKKNMNPYILIIIGLLIMKVLSIIPFIGEFISIISVLLGLGIIGNMIIEVKK